MASLSWKVTAYLKANGKTDSQINLLFDNETVLLQNNGEGDYLHSWNVDGLAQPTQEQLDALDATATTDYNNFKVRKARKKSYGNIGDQLDEIFKDIDAWKVRIQAIKDANQKE